jgi:hypothetical protein
MSKNKENKVDLEAKLAEAKAEAEKAKADKPVQPKLTDAEKLALKEQKAAERAQRKLDRGAVKEQKTAERLVKKAERDKLRAEKKAARAIKPSRLEKAANRLPSLPDSTTDKLDELCSNADAFQLNALMEHIRFRISALGVKTSKDVKPEFEPGDTVMVASGPSRYVGREGVVSQVRRIRCIVRFPDKPKKDVYLYLSDVAAVAVKAQATG